jgi:hypothetical protein
MNPKCSVCGSAMLFEQTNEGKWEERRWRCLKDCRGSERVLVFYNPKKLDIIPDTKPIYRSPLTGLNNKQGMGARHCHCMICGIEIFGKNSRYCDVCLKEFSEKYLPKRRKHHGK